MSKELEVMQKWDFWDHFPTGLRGALWKIYSNTNIFCSSIVLTAGTRFDALVLLEFSSSKLRSWPYLSLSQSSQLQQAHFYEVLLANSLLVNQPKSLLIYFFLKSLQGVPLEILPFCCYGKTFGVMIFIIFFFSFLGTTWKSWFPYNFWAWNKNAYTYR